MGASYSLAKSPIHLLTSESDIWLAKIFYLLRRIRSLAKGRFFIYCVDHVAREDGGHELRRSTQPYYNIYSSFISVEIRIEVLYIYQYSYVHCSQLLCIHEENNIYPSQFHL